MLCLGRRPRNRSTEILAPDFRRQNKERERSLALPRNFRVAFRTFVRI
jgi:hypothetical protein